MNIKKLAALSAIGLLIFAFSTQANAASFDDMKRDVEAGTGSVYNTELNRAMTPEETKDYITIVENEMNSESLENPTAEMLQKAQSEVIQKNITITGTVENNEKDMEVKPTTANAKSNNITIFTATSLPIGIFSIGQLLMKKIVFSFMLSLNYQIQF